MGLSSCELFYVLSPQNTADEVKKVPGDDGEAGPMVNFFEEVQ